MSYRMSDILDLPDCFLRPNYALLLGPSARRAATATSVPESPDAASIVCSPGLSFVFRPLQPISTSAGTSAAGDARGECMQLHIPTPDPMTGSYWALQMCQVHLHVLSHFISTAAPWGGWHIDTNTPRILQLLKQSRVKWLGPDDSW
ncbi:unnamed protein product [Rangifer tarandus platyrhynchus]|uniref:Uncharacterized protein n=1 Tax=Rangifer tarandus platyrhynchus TaxID=3082113 RepID=A0AC60A267_RANTA